MLIRSAELHLAAHTPEQLKRDDTPHIAFAGRSNVGKSSLINALLNRKNLARTSSTPGKTRAIFFFRVNNAFTFADLPGYGYAKVSKGERQFFRVLVDRYFEFPDNPKACVILIDPRRPVGEEELSFLAYLTNRNMKSLVIMTKWDRVKAAQRVKMRRARELELAAHPVKVLPVSSKTGEGLDQLWHFIERNTKDFLSPDA